jgi:hypothetical protein
MKVGDLVRGDFSNLGDDSAPNQLGVVVRASNHQVSIHWPLDACVLTYNRKWWYMLEVVNESR